MTKRLLTLGTFAALAIGLTTFTGSAMAGNGNGATPPGQEKKADQAAPVAQQPAAQPAAATRSTSPGQAKQAARAASSTPGVKPSNSTSHWKQCSAGGTPTAATCSGNGPKADGSKQYGNGQTAAQIAVSRGAPAGTVLTGPGNSQPHKVTVCGKPNNKSGGVDVHAVKSYSAADCAAVPLQRTEATEQHTDCAGTTVTSTSTSTTFANKDGKVKVHGNAGSHGKHKGLVAVPPAIATSSNAACGATQSTGTAATLYAATGTGTPAATGTEAATGTATATATAAPAARPTGGVLGAQATLVRPAKKPAGGVLGAATRLGNFATRGTLPFTGLPLWIAALAALALIAAGLTLRTHRPSEEL